MVSDLVESHVEWTTPEPFWSLTGEPTVTENRRQFRTPAILRFATDSFMDDFLNLLKTEPQRLQEFVAIPETWDSPPGEPPPPQSMSGLALKLFRARAAAVRRLQARGRRVLGASQSSPGAVRPLKLYQPVHQRFYLVTTCLVCRLLGLPDRRINTAAQERVSFLVRLLQPHANANQNQPDPRDCDEFALVNGAWTQVANPDSFTPGEEQRPLSPAAYQQDDQRRRRLLVGLVPVGDRERLLQAVQPNPAGQPPLPPLIDARLMLFKTQVIGPLKNLEDLADRAVKATLPPDPTDPTQPPLTQDQENAREAALPQTIQNANDQLQQASWYILLDMARYFETYLTDLWNAIQNGDGSNLTNPLKSVWDTLSAITYSGLTLVDALKMAHAAATTLESVRTTYQSNSATGQAGWPSFLFSFYSVSTATDAKGHPIGQKQGLSGLANQADREALETKVSDAVQALTPTPKNPLPVRLTAQANANPQATPWFTIRCVLERPNCGALTAPLVSEPTIAFQMASYFDSDAPARPIRIGLPVDTTPAGLRKFDKNTAFVMSDTLCGQVGKLSSASFGDLVLSVLPWPFHKDLSPGGGQPCTADSNPAGMVCSFSIPIITICALILLIIFVKLLDIIFFWMPFFQICLPLPKFSAKD